MSISAFTASACEDGRLRPYVFNALWKSGSRFSDKDMHQTKKLERTPIRPKRDALRIDWAI
jgi:hypothetical protein